jgi:hypothetical protein
MFKRFTALLLIGLMVMANFSKLFIYAGFEANQGYIAAKLCENRSKPWMHCNGRCYLMKKIKQAEEKERSAERQVQKSLIQDACFTVSYSFKFHAQLLRSVEVPYLAMQPQQVVLSLLRPPRVA